MALTMVDNLIETIKKLVYLVEDMVDSVFIHLVDTTPENLVPSESVISTSTNEIVPHTNTEIDDRFLDANHAILRCIGQSVPLTEHLGRFNYSSIRSEVVEVFSMDKVARLSRFIKSFNDEISKAMGFIDDLNHLVEPSQLKNASVVIDAMTKALNTIADAINNLIDRHNEYFKNSPPHQVDRVTKLK